LAPGGKRERETWSKEPAKFHSWRCGTLGQRKKTKGLARVGGDAWRGIRGLLLAATMGQKLRRG